MFILILIDVQYSQKAIEKRFESPKSLLLRFPSPGKKILPSKVSDSHPLGESSPPLATIWKTLVLMNKTQC